MKHTENDAVRRLNLKQDCKISNYDILVLSDNSANKVYDLGNKSWGRIDYLKHLGYRQFFVDKF